MRLILHVDILASFWLLITLLVKLVIILKLINFYYIKIVHTGSIIILLFLPLTITDVFILFFTSIFEQTAISLFERKYDAHI
jgi:hypothetical protein